jgi:hypothetical protein
MFTTLRELTLFAIFESFYFPPLVCLIFLIKKPTSRNKFLIPGGGLSLTIMMIQFYMTEPPPFQEFRISMQQHIICVTLFNFINSNFSFITRSFIRYRNLHSDVVFYLFAALKVKPGSFCPAFRPAPWKHPPTNHG